MLKSIWHPLPQKFVYIGVCKRVLRSFRLSFLKIIVIYFLLGKLILILSYYISINCHSWKCAVLGWSLFRNLALMIRQGLSQIGYIVIKHDKFEIIQIYTSCFRPLYNSLSSLPLTLITLYLHPSSHLLLHSIPMADRTYKTMFWFTADCTSFIIYWLFWSSKIATCF